MTRSNVISLADVRARREGWEQADVEALLFSADESFTLRFVDEAETYEVRANRAWMEALHAKLGRVLGK